MAKKPPASTPKTVQYDLFSSFLGNESELSNTIELWDAIPKYVVSYRRQGFLRNNGRLPLYKQDFVYATRRNDRREEHSCRVSIQPATIETDKGDIDFYPSTDEELVEEVLRKIFVMQTYGMHDPRNAESWVRFSVQMIRRELAERGKTRSATEIKRSLEILSRTHVSLYVDSDTEPSYSAPILSDVTRVTRKDYLADSSNTWVARLPALISKSVNELSYRQFNYGILMDLDAQISRWVHKRMSHHYTNASPLHPYTPLFRSFQRDSGLLDCRRTKEAVSRLESAFDDLKAHNVISHWERTDERLKGRTILDIKYSIRPHPQFVTEMKAANARVRKSRESLHQIPSTPQVTGTPKKIR